MGQNPSHLSVVAALATSIKIYCLVELKKKKKAQTLKYEQRNSDIHLEFTLFHVNKQLQKWTYWKMSAK